MKKLLFTIFFFTAFMGVKSAHASFFGNLVGHNNKEGPTSVMICASGTPATDGTLTSISNFASSSVGTTITGGVAIYSDNGASRPNHPLASQTFSLPLAGGAAWSTTTVSLALTGGTVYWLCEWANGNYNYYDSGAGSWANLAGSFPTWPDPATAASFATTRKIAIYATYTPSGGGGTVTAILDYIFTLFGDW